MMPPVHGNGQAPRVDVHWVYVAWCVGLVMGMALVSL